MWGKPAKPRHRPHYAQAESSGWPLSALSSWFSQLTTGRHSTSANDLESAFSVSQLQEMRMRSAREAEGILKQICLEQYGVEVKVAVFQRVKEDRGQLLALIRPEHGERVPFGDPQQFSQELLFYYSRYSHSQGIGHIRYAVWLEQTSDGAHSAFAALAPHSTNGTVR